MIGGIFGWLLGKVMSFANSGIVQRAIDVYNTSQDRGVKLAQIGADVEATSTAARVTLQTNKMNQPVFWLVIVIMMLPAAWQLWGVTLYNTFWHANGIWPQPWNIAAYPPSVAPWVNASIDWLYNPIGVPGTVASAWLAGRVTGR